MQEIYAGEKDVDVSLILYICPKNRVEVENLFRVVINVLTNLKRFHRPVSSSLSI